MRDVQFARQSFSSKARNKLDKKQLIHLQKIAVGQSVIEDFIFKFNKYNQQITLSLFEKFRLMVIDYNQNKTADFFGSSVDQATKDKFGIFLLGDPSNSLRL